MVAMSDRSPARPGADEQRERLSRALYAIHQRSSYFTGLTLAGELHLMNGGSIGGEDGMPMSVGMNEYSCCRACHHRKEAKDAWPCDTVKLLVEAGVVAALRSELTNG